MAEASICAETRPFVLVSLVSFELITSTSLIHLGLGPTYGGWPHCCYPKAAEDISLLPLLLGRRP